MSKKEAYEKKLQAQLDEWRAEIDKLKAKADSAQADAQLEYQKQIEDLRSMQDSASEKLSELKAAGDEAWEDLKAGIDSAWNSLGGAIKTAASKRTASASRPARAWSWRSTNRNGATKAGRSRPPRWPRVG
jgi:uncharacterized coiled-coil DUF342 family protein